MSFIMEMLGAGGAGWGRRNSVGGVSRIQRRLGVNGGKQNLFMLYLYNWPPPKEEVGRYYEHLEKGPAN